MTNCKNCNAILTHNNGRIYCEYCGTVYSELYPDLGGDTDTIEVTTLNGFHEYWYLDNGLDLWKKGIKLYVDD